MYFLLITIFDQLIKHFIVATNCNVPIIKNIFNLTFVKNTGGIYGMFQNSNYAFILISLIVLCSLGIYVYKNDRKEKLKIILWQLVFAGGVSNMIDRIFRGYVVDFIQLKFFGVFNLADACIVLSIIAIIFLELKGSISESNKIKSN